MPKNAVYGIVMLIAVVAIVTGVWYLRDNGSKNKTASANDSTSSMSTVTPTPSSSPEGGQQMQVEDIVVGTGEEAVSGKTVTVNYVGTLTDGTKFDASADHGQPFSFELGAGRVIKGWDQGVAGMKVGGKRKLTIPPDLAYGNQAVGTIPSNSTLVFEVELLKVE